jgi:hypothetical protein
MKIILGLEVLEHLPGKYEVHCLSPHTSNKYF